MVSTNAAPAFPGKSIAPARQDPNISRNVNGFLMLLLAPENKLLAVGYTKSKKKNGHPGFGVAVKVSTDLKRLIRIRHLIHIVLFSHPYGAVIIIIAGAFRSPA
jgi:hypothetical protein